MDGTKHILVFSMAGGTGRSYHADLSCANTERRIHYLLEPGWRADQAIQGSSMDCAIGATEEPPPPQAVSASKATTLNALIIEIGFMALSPKYTNDQPRHRRVPGRCRHRTGT